MINWHESTKKSQHCLLVWVRDPLCVCVCVCVMVVTEKLRKGRSNNGFPGSVACCRSLLLVNVFFLREIIWFLIFWGVLLRFFGCKAGKLLCVCVWKTIKSAAGCVGSLSLCVCEWFQYQCYCCFDFALETVRRRRRLFDSFFCCVMRQLRSSEPLGRTRAAPAAAKCACANDSWNGASIERNKVK